jgi:hypothetical protein
LVGEHAGLAAMFTMMNNARLGVAMQGIGVAEAAYQHALAYRTAKQAKLAHQSLPNTPTRRMLASMKADFTRPRNFAGRGRGSTCPTQQVTRMSAGSVANPDLKGVREPISALRSLIDGHPPTAAWASPKKTGAAQYTMIRHYHLARAPKRYPSHGPVAQMMDGGDAAPYPVWMEIEVAAEAAKAAMPDLAEPGFGKLRKQFRETTGMAG